jgi:hypothetical protein
MTTGCRQIMTLIPKKAQLNILDAGSKNGWVVDHLSKIKVASPHQLSEHMA